MSALLRLLERQGLFKGDINHLQRFALQEIIKNEYRDRQKLETERIKMQAAIAHPHAAKKIFAESEDEGFDVPEIEEFDPDSPGFSQQSIETMLAALEEFGFYAEGNVDET